MFAFLMLVGFALSALFLYLAIPRSSGVGGYFWAWLAPAPLWFVTLFYWGDIVVRYPWWFWALFWVNLVVTLIALLPIIRTFWGVWVISVILIVTMLWFIVPHGYHRIAGGGPPPAEATPVDCPVVNNRLAEIVPELEALQTDFLSDDTPAGQDSIQKQIDALEREYNTLNGSHEQGNCDGTVDVPIPTVTVSPSEEAATNIDGICQFGHVVDLPDRGDNRRLNVNGATVRGVGSEEAFRDQILQQAATDPLTLYNQYQVSILGVEEPLPSVNVLVEGGVIREGVCYSARGIEAYNDWAEVWEDETLTLLEWKEDITHDDVNTGVSDDGQSIVHGEAVTGDQEGVDVTMYDEDGNMISEYSVLYRCTQVTDSVAPPNTPSGVTDNPAPRPTATHKVTVRPSSTPTKGKTATKAPKDVPVTTQPTVTRPTARPPAPAPTTSKPSSTPTKGKTATKAPSGAGDAVTTQPTVTRPTARPPAPAPTTRPAPPPPAQPTRTPQVTVTTPVPEVSSAPPAAPDVEHAPDSTEDCDKDNNGIPDPGCG